MKKHKLILFILFSFVNVLSYGQNLPPKPDSIMLILWEPIQIEVTEAVDLMYNFKFKEANTKFYQLKDIYPEHPLPYYLIALNNWWQIMPYKEEDPRIEQFAPQLIEFADLAIEKAEAMYDENEEDPEAVFFLCASHALQARYYAENNIKLSAINQSRKTFSYFKKLQDKKDLSPEFLFGSALFNYYEAWFKEEYNWIKPILAFFPNGDKELGIEQLKKVSREAFWTRTEANYFLMRIYYNEEDNDIEALPYALRLHKEYPDNAYFHRLYARMLYTTGKWTDCLPVTEKLLQGVENEKVGYEETSGRYAGFFLGRIYRSKGLEIEAKRVYEKGIAYAEKIKDTDQNYYLYSLDDLAKMSIKDNDINKAKECYAKILDNTNRKHALHKTAKVYLKNH